jgi:hypothetical protein
VEPTTLLAGLGEHRAQRTPKPQRTIADGEDRGAHPAPMTVAQQIGPGLGGRAVTIGQRDELFAPIGAHPEHHQQAQLVLVETRMLTWIPSTHRYT